MIQRITSRRAAATPEPEPVAPASLELDACYRYCEALCRARHHNYPVASFLTRSGLRRHIWAIFAFARVADDFVDEPAFAGRRARELDAWEAMLHQTYFGAPPAHPVMIALADTVTKFNLPITEFAALLSGLRCDLETTRYATFAELRAYTSQAAEPLGHLLLYVGGYRAPELLAYADDLASALAVTRLIQDIPADLARGRVYLPLEDLRHFGVDLAALEARAPTPAIDALLRYEVARTRALFERARPLIDLVGGDLAVELALMWHGGTRMLDKIADAGSAVLVERPSLSTGDKAIALARAIAWRGETLGPRGLALLTRTLG